MQFVHSVRLIVATFLVSILARQVVLVHGRSRVVTSVLKHAKQQGKSFSVIVTEGRPHGQGCVARNDFLLLLLLCLFHCVCACVLTGVFLPPGTERPKS